MSEQKPQILVVDDYPEIRKLLACDVLVSRLRRKLDGPGTTRLLKTVRNSGYQFAVKIEHRDFPS